MMAWTDVLQLQGDPVTIGCAHGEAVAGFLAESLDRYLSGFIDTGMAKRDELPSRGATWLAGIPQRYRQELECETTCRPPPHLLTGRITASL